MTNEKQKIEISIEAVNFAQAKEILDDLEFLSEKYEISAVISISCQINTYQLFQQTTY
mgnify:CR=1 FL=1